MSSPDFTAAFERARTRLDLEHPRVQLTWRNRLYHFFFGVWPPEVAAENWTRAHYFHLILDAEVRDEVARHGDRHA